MTSLKKKKTTKQQATVFQIISQRWFTLQHSCNLLNEKSNSIFCHFIEVALKHQLYDPKITQILRLIYSDINFIDFTRK